MIKHFTDLDAWKEGHLLVLMVYRMTKAFPKEEIYGLTSQIRRAAVSVTSNIAEGFSRFHYKDRVNFYYDSRGSVAEVENQLLIAKDLSFISADTFTNLWQQAEKVAIILNGLINKTKLA
jgi:four helix bundle protein